MWEQERGNKIYHKGEDEREKRETGVIEGVRLIIRGRGGRCHIPL